MPIDNLEEYQREHPMAVGFRTYHETKMKMKLHDCDPTIWEKETLATDEREFLSKSEIRERCECMNKETCLQIVDLLDHHKFTEAEDLLVRMKHGTL
jgi:hypothetical protein